VRPSLAVKVCAMTSALLVIAMASACRGGQRPVDPAAALPVPAPDAAEQPGTTAVSGPPTVPAGPGVATLTKVVDGDTIVVRLAGRTERVRLIGIDTPESVKPDSPVECFGPEASDRLRTLLPAGTAVELVRDAELRDTYGRLLAYVFRRPDGLFVNLSMAENGYAGTLSIAPNTTFAADFAAAVTQARRLRLGLWGACPSPDTLFS